MQTAPLPVLRIKKALEDMRDEIRLEAPAKINLALHVLGKRPDGYHDLVTVFHRLNLCDELRLVRTRSAGISIRCPQGGAPEGPENLACRAAALFFERTGVPPALSIELHKSIPTAAGLGGGSSDAASVLLGLNRLYGEPLAFEVLTEIGMELGADVPFFLWEVTSAVGEGRGDRIRPVTIPDGTYVLVNPGFPVSTAWAYESLDRTRGKYELTNTQNALIRQILNYSSLQAGALLHNDLEEATLKRFPIISQIEQTLLGLGCDAALMSGSGPTVFGHFSSRSKAEEAYRTLKRESAFSCFLTRSC